jgi:hypothetical protein
MVANRWFPHKAHSCPPHSSATLPFQILSNGDPILLSSTLNGDTLQLRGQLYAAGKNIPLDVNATLTPAGDEFEIEASPLADHRELGMTWSPMGVMRTPSKLIVRGRLVRAES